MYIYTYIHTWAILNQLKLHLADAIFLDFV